MDQTFFYKIKPETLLVYSILLKNEFLFEFIVLNFEFAHLNF